MSLRGHDWGVLPLRTVSIRMGETAHTFPHNFARTTYSTYSFLPLRQQVRARAQTVPPSRNSPSTLCCASDGAPLLSSRKSFYTPINTTQPPHTCQDLFEMCGTRLAGTKDGLYQRPDVPASQVVKAAPGFISSA